MTQITDLSRLAELREMNNPSNNPAHCKYCGSSLPQHGETCKVCGNVNVAFNASCISCGGPINEHGGPHPRTTMEEPICVECVTSAQGQMNRMHVYVAINGERDYQDQKHGPHRHTMPEWITIIEGILGKAKAQFAGGQPDCEVAMRHEMRKVAGCAVACMEQNGIEFRDAGQPPTPTVNVIMQSDLRKSVERTLNCFSAENGSNTPDFILAEYLLDCLGAYDKAVTAREKWYGREPVPVPPDQAPPRPDVVGKPFLSSI